MVPSVITEIQGSMVPCDAIAVRDLNFGQPVYDLPVTRYRVRLATEVWVPLIRPHYERLIRDLLEDEPYDVGINEATNHLRDAGWPDLDTLRARHPQVLMELLQAFMIHDLLTELFSPAHAEIRYVINSIDVLRVHDGNLLIEGDAFSPRKDSP